MNSPPVNSPVNQMSSPSPVKRAITSPGVSKQQNGSRPTSPTPKVSIRSAPGSNTNSTNNSPAVSPRRNNDPEDAWRESRGKVIRELVETEQIFHSFTQILINVSTEYNVHNYYLIVDRSCTLNWSRLTFEMLTFDKLIETII